MAGRDQLPFFLHEAVITLFPAQADGQSLAGGAIWSGALATHLAIRSSLEEMKIAGSGDLYMRAMHLDEEHIIDIARTWILQRYALADFFPARNQQYVLQIVYTSDGVWYQRTFFGVTGRVVAHESQGTNQFVVSQTFRAQHFSEANGTTGPSPVYTPTPQPGQSVGFFREDPFVDGEYLLGNYRWANNVVIGVVDVIGLAGQSTPTVLTLEVGGVLTGETITISAGTANAEVTASEDLAGYFVPAEQSVRWKITSGPALPENAMWGTALSMQVTPQ